MNSVQFERKKTFPVALYERGVIILEKGIAHEPDI
jgi:hypothetical protein